MMAFKFSRQMPVGRFIADFMCREASLIVEVDGGQHDSRSAAEAERTEFLENEGYRVIRFWNNEVLENIEGVLITIQQALNSCPPPPAPARGRGDDMPTPLKGRGD
jgi:very-short-patch-repair endonuclease